MNRFFNTTIFISFLFISFQNFGQVSETIQSDRPGQAFTQYTAGKNILQLQSGVGFFSSKNDFFTTENIYKSLVLRYGIKENIELNAAFNHSSIRVKDNPPVYFETLKLSGIDQFNFGFRIHLFERPSGFAGSIETRARLNFLTSDEVQSEDDLGFISSISLGYPVGSSRFTFIGSTTDNIPFLFVVNYSLGISETVSTFVEFYGSYNDEFSNALDGGFAFLLNKDLQLDISGGIDIDEGLNYFFVEGGVSYRLFSLK